MGINKQIIIDIIKKYYILGSGTKVEEAISGKNYSGWVFNSLRKVIPIDVKKYPDVNAFIEEFNYEIDQYLVNIEKMIDEKDY